METPGSGLAAARPSSIFAQDLPRQQLLGEGRQQDPIAVVSDGRIVAFRGKGADGGDVLRSKGAEPSPRFQHRHLCQEGKETGGALVEPLYGLLLDPVSYTHMTLPTIYSV